MADSPDDPLPVGEWLNDAFDSTMTLFRQRNGKQQEENIVQASQVRTLGPPATIPDPTDLSLTYWAIIMPQQPTAAEQAHRDLLKPLIAHRSAQMQKPVKILDYEAGQSAEEFLFADGKDVGWGQMNVCTVPYYLLIVASPERISWEFQADLDAEYAVGRLWFDDITDCQSYVEKRVAYEQSLAAVPPPTARSVFFAPYQPGDSATTQSANEFVTPLMEWLSTRTYEPSAYFGDTATRAKLLNWLGSRRVTSPPTLLFSASHGMEYPLPQFDAARLGALVCQDWPGKNGVSPEHLISAADVAALPEADFSAMMAYLFACFSAGSPREAERFPVVVPGEPLSARIQIAPTSCISHLPQKLLAGGMGAVLGHVDRAFTYTFKGLNLWRPQLSNFEALFAQLLRGVPIGHATDDLNKRALSETAAMNRLLLRQSTTPLSDVEKKDFVRRWVSRMDGRYHLLLGDPAARLHSTIAW